MPAISPLPPAPSISDPTNFNAEADAWVAAIDPMTDEINALEAGLRAAANPISLPYTFSTTTTDSDPGAGVLRLGSATQNAATVIRVDLVDDLGVTRTTQLDTFGDSTNPVKGWLRLQKAGDASAFLDFRVTALTRAHLKVCALKGA